jgi:hypothetical protein
MGNERVEDKEQRNYERRRRLVEIAEETASKMQLFCFIKDIPMNYFATKAIEKELKPYETQIESIKRLKFGYKG